MSNLLQPHEADWYEASARERVAGLLDPKSFAEFLGPEQRAMSPHLAQFDLTGAFDDGIVVGRGRLDGQEVFVAAQEGRFMGGAFGEVHGAKLVGLLRAARDATQARGGPRAVLLLLDTGGVRLQEANAGELAISEIIRAIVEAAQRRHPGRGSDRRPGRLLRRRRHHHRLLQPYRRFRARTDKRQRPGGHRDQQGRGGVRLQGSRPGLARLRRPHALPHRRRGPLCEGKHPGFPRSGDCADHRMPRPSISRRSRPSSGASPERLQRFGDCRDAPEIWRKAGLPEPERIADISDDAFLAIQRLEGSRS